MHRAGCVMRAAAAQAQEHGTPRHAVFKLRDECWVQGLCYSGALKLEINHHGVGLLPQAIQRRE